MAKTHFYAIKRNGKYLQGIEANENYATGACAPTMGVRHTLSEYRSIWDKDPKRFEPLTAANYIKVIFEEYRWETKSAADIKIEVSE